MRNWQRWLTAGLVFSLSGHLNPAGAQQPNDIVSFYRAAIKHVVLARDHTSTGQLTSVGQPTSYDGHPGWDFVGAPVTSLVVSVEYQDAKPEDAMEIRLYPDNGGPEDQTVVRSCEFPLYPASGAKGCRLCFPVQGDRAISETTSLAPGKYLIGIYVNETVILQAPFRVKTAAQPTTSCTPGTQTFTSIQETRRQGNQQPSASSQTSSSATITKDSVACNNSNTIFNYRTMLNNREMLSEKIDPKYAEAIRTLRFSEDYKSLLPYRNLLYETDSFAYMALTMIRTSIEVKGDCVWVRKGARVSVIAIDQQGRLTQIRSGNQNGDYWVWSDSLAAE